MENIDSLKRNDEVSLTILGADNSRLYQSTNTGYHSIEAAIRDALDNADLNVNPENCVFEVTNQTTGVSHRYRLNAHGHLKLIV